MKSEKMFQAVIEAAYDEDRGLTKLLTCISYHMNNPLDYEDCSEETARKELKRLIEHAANYADANNL